MCVNVSSNKSNSIYESLLLSLDSQKTPEVKTENKKAAQPEVLKEDSFKSPEGPKLRFEENDSLNEVFQARKTLKKGASGEDVKLIQNSLKDMGFYVGDKIDGKYTTQTATAVKNFQDNRGLKQTGIIDKTTMEELNKVCPPTGKTLWDAGVLEQITQTTKDEKIVPSNVVAGNKRAKIVVDLSEHRLFLFDDNNNVKKVYSVATGKGGWADKRGGKTKAGIKVIDSKIKDPSGMARELWPETKGKAFGTRMLALSFINPVTGRKTNSGEELHGTFARNSVGTDASHGCMRMENEDIEEVFSQVKAGDLVKVQD